MPKRKHATQPKRRPIPPWCENPTEFDRRILLMHNPRFRNWLEDATARLRSFENAADWN